MSDFERWSLAVLVGQLIVFGGQLWVFWRQIAILRTQASTQQSLNEWRQVEAIGEFYRLAFIMSDKVRDLAHPPYNWHPRTLREGLDAHARTFAPLGNKAVIELARARATLDQLESAVRNWFVGAAARDGRELAALENSVEILRGGLAAAFERAHQQIPPDLRRIGSFGPYRFDRLGEEGG